MESSSKTWLNFNFDYREMNQHDNNCHFKKLEDNRVFSSKYILIIPPNYSQFYNKDVNEGVSALYISSFIFHDV